MGPETAIRLTASERPELPDQGELTVCNSTAIHYGEARKRKSPGRLAAVGAGHHPVIAVEQLGGHQEWIKR